MEKPAPEHLSRHRVAKALELWLFPSLCIVCGGAARRVDLCQGCTLDLPWNFNACLRCAEPRGENMPICGTCIADPPPWRAAMCPFRYTFPVDRLLQQLKFARRVCVGRVLGTLAGEWLASTAVALPDVVVPVPLHRGRERRRGYNQSLEIARPIAARLGLPLDDRLCRRRRATDEQSGLEGPARRRNVRNAFAVTGNCHGARVGVVDDVITTGATAAEIARTLLAAGAASVDIWATARTA